MIILHCISSLSGGGAERQLSYLAPELSKKGLNVHIIYLNKGPNPPCFANTSVRMHHIITNNNYDPWLFIKICLKINKINPDIIQTWNLQMDVMMD